MPDSPLDVLKKKLEAMADGGIPLSAFPEVLAVLEASGDGSQKAPQLDSIDPQKVEAS